MHLISNGDGATREHPAQGLKQRVLDYIRPFTAQAPAPGAGGSVDLVQDTGGRASLPCLFPSLNMRAEAVCWGAPSQC